MGCLDLIVTDDVDILLNFVMRPCAAVRSPIRDLHDWIMMIGHSG